MAASDAPSSAAGGVRAWAPYVLTALLIWLAWQVVIGLLIQRAPPEMAIRVAPGSPTVMSRAAEAELVAGRVDQARDLAELALRASPFDVRALRVLGLSIARFDESAADPILTLSGNWSLRDDPSHAWLLTRRLRQGDYVGSFGHADALARRREDLRPGIFRYFATAAAEDPRAVPALLERLAVQPNWRSEFLTFLRAAANGAPVQAALAVGLDDTPGALTDRELEVLYMDWLNAGRIPGLLAIRERTGRPAWKPVVDGDFESPGGPMPFRWWIEDNVGTTAIVSRREDGNALLVETDGFGNGNVLAQLLSLKPGPYEFRFESSFDLPAEASTLRWVLICVETNRAALEREVPVTSNTVRTAVDFRVPADDCTVQWLRLNTLKGPRRTSIRVWIDDVAITRGDGQ